MQQSAVAEAAVPIQTRASLSRKLVAEGLGTMLLLAAVVGSGIMGEQLSGGNVGIALLANSVATGAVLIAIILAFGAISGAHFNPAVTVAAAIDGSLSWKEAPSYVLAQFMGAFSGVAIAHLMFQQPAFSASGHVRSGGAQLIAEWVATFGLLSVIFGCIRARSDATPFAVGAYITGAYWFTSSTSFANPAVTLARAMTNTFSGIRLVDVPGFIAMQILGAVVATFLWSWLSPSQPETATTLANPQRERTSSSHVR
jgi:glycerol uptake facilitator-like aquaporin